MMQEEQYVVKAERLAYRAFEDEAFILTPEDSTLHCLNETGSRIWQLIDGLRTLGDIADAIYDEYDVKRDRALEEVRRFLQTLQAKGMIAVSNEPLEVEASD